MLLGGPPRAQVGRGMVIFWVPPGTEQCCRLRVRGAASHSRDAHWVPTTLAWLCSGRCHLGKWAGKPSGVF